MIITDQIAKLQLPIQIITLNTGLLNPETEALIAATRQHYRDSVAKCFNRKPVIAAQFVQQHV